MHTRSFIVLAALGTCAVASAQSAVIKYKFRKGEVHRYSMDMSMKMAFSQHSNKPMNLDTLGVFKQAVQSVSSDGSGTVALTVEKMTTQMNGKSQTENSNSTSIVKISPTGGTTIVSSPTTKQNGNLSSMQMMSNFPKSPVRAGNTWESNFNMPGAPMNMAGAFKLTNKVEKITRSMGKTVAFIHSTGTLDMGKLLHDSKQMPAGSNAKGGMTADLHYIFNISEGLVQSMDGTASINVNFSGLGPQSGTMSGGMRMAFRLLN
jgi:hypothetical protein